MEAALSLQEDLGTPHRIAGALFAIGLLKIKQGEYTRAFASFEEGLALFRRLDNKRGKAASLTQMAAALFVSQGDQPVVYPLLAQGLSLDREVGDKEGLAVSSLLVVPVGLSEW